MVAIGAIAITNVQIHIIQTRTAINHRVVDDKTFQMQYTEQWNALDDIAERSRALGFNAPGSYTEFIRLTSLPEEPGLTAAPDWRRSPPMTNTPSTALTRH